MTTIEDVTLSVPDVSCEHCVQTIHNTLSPLAGVEAVDTSIPAKTVHLRFDPKQIGMEQIEAALDDAGYTVAK